MNKSIIIAVAAIVVVAAAIAIVQQPEQKTEVKVGVMAPQTGLAAWLGTQMLHGMELAANESGSPLQLAVEDDQCDAKTGLTVAKKLVEEDKVDAILGSICTVSILSSAPYLEEAQVPTITTGLVLQKTANAGDWHFAFLPEMNHQMRAIAKFAKSQNFRSIGTIAINDDLGRESISELKIALADENISLVAEEYFDRPEKDFRTMLAKVEDKKPDAIYLMGYAGNLVAIVKQASELNIETPLLTWSLFQDPAVLNGLGSLAEKVRFSYPEDPRDLPVKAAFKQKFLEAFGEEPSLYAANGYDSYKLLAEAVKACGKDRACIKAKLYQVKGWEGANGFITVDKRGVGQRAEVSIKTVKDGKFITIG